MTGTTAGDALPGAAGEMSAALLPIAFPGFWFGQLAHRRHRPRWVAVCKDDTGTGLYAVVAVDLGALTAALTLDRGWPTGRSPLAAPPPGPPRPSPSRGAGCGNPVICPGDL